MRPLRLTPLMCTCAIMLVMAAHPARADAIDGHWCFPDGKRMSIQGSSIVTPDGTPTQGNYARHFFTYVVPPAGQCAGNTISMALVNEDTMHLRVGTVSDVPVQVWHRCGSPTS